MRIAQFSFVSEGGCAGWHREGHRPSPQLSKTADTGSMDTGGVLVSVKCYFEIYTKNINDVTREFAQI